MGKPYSDIMKAQRLMTEFNKLQEYRTNQGQEGYEGVGTRGQRKATKGFFVKPFLFDIEADQVLQANADPAAFTVLGAIVNGVTGVAVDEAAGANTVIETIQFSAARVRWKRNNTYSTEKRTSRRTGRVRLHYNGETSTLPFGRDLSGGGNVNEQDAFSEIKEEIKKQDERFPINQVAWVREKVAL